MRSLTVDSGSHIKQNQNKSLILNKLFKPDNNIFNSVINKIQSSEYANTKEKFNQNTKTIFIQIDKKEFTSDFEEGNGNIKVEQENEKSSGNSSESYDLNQNQLKPKKSQLSPRSPATPNGQNFISQYQTRDSNKKDDLKLADIILSNNVNSSKKPCTLEFQIDKEDLQNKLSNEQFSNTKIYLN